MLENNMNEEIVEVTEKAAEKVVEEVVTNGNSGVLKKAGAAGLALVTVAGIVAGVIYIKNKKAKKTEEAEATEQVSDEESVE